MDTRQELENMEVELKKLQQEVMPQVTATLTHADIHMTSSPLHPLFSLLSKYFVSAALPGFNQLASDLAH